VITAKLCEEKEWCVSSAQIRSTNKDKADEE